MGRRAVFMYGALLPRNARGGANGGLGQTTSTGLPTLIIPTDIINTPFQKMTVDGVDMEFQLTPGTEAPAEMNTCFPQFTAMWMAENSTNTMHNLLTLRGAQVRDPLKWAQFLEIRSPSTDRITARERFSESLTGRSAAPSEIIDDRTEIRATWTKCMHDQSVRLMNQGLRGPERSRRRSNSSPPGLDQYWPNRG